MTGQHPITPPPELVQRWTSLAGEEEESCKVWASIAIQAAQWGADQELEACCEWTQGYAECGDSLRLARRPKPPSLRKQACDALDTYVYGDPSQDDKVRTYNTIRAALDALPND
jgi:hypothetical protein